MIAIKANNNHLANFSGGQSKHLSVFSDVPNFLSQRVAFEHEQLARIQLVLFLAELFP